MRRGMNHPLYPHDRMGNVLGVGDPVMVRDRAPGVVCETYDGASCSLQVRGKDGSVGVVDCTELVRGFPEPICFVVRELRGHMGRDEAVSVATIAGRMGLSDLEVRRAVRELRNFYGWPVGSVTSKPPGYYLIADEEELKAAYESLRRRGLRILVTARQVRRNGKRMLSEGFGMLELAG